MEGIAELLEKAESSSLQVWVEGGEVVVKGPKRAEALAKAIIARKSEVFDWLANEDKDVARPGNASTDPRCRALAYSFYCSQNGSAWIRLLS